MKNYCSSFLTILLLTSPLYSMGPEHRPSLLLPLKEMKDPFALELSSPQSANALSSSSTKQYLTNEEIEDDAPQKKMKEKIPLEESSRIADVSPSPSPENSLSKEQLEHLEEIFANIPTEESSSPRIIHQQMTDSQNSDLSRTFPIYSYKKILEWEDQEIIDDALENCPSSLKEDLHDLICYANQPKNSNSKALPINRIIFEGPSGSGKTTLAESIIYATKRNFSYIKSNELSNSYRKGFVTIINNLFAPFLKNKQPGAIIFEEFGSFANKTKNDFDYEESAVSQLWQKIDEANRLNPNLLIIFIANDLSKLPETLCTRFDEAIHRVEQPSLERRIRTIHRSLGSLPNFTAQYEEELARKTASLSLRQINQGLKKACNRAELRAASNSTLLQLTPAHIDEAFLLSLKKADERLWKERKERAYEILKTASPYLITIGLAGIGFEIQRRFNNENRNLTIANHEASMAAAAAQHAASLAAQAASLSAQNDAATKNLSLATNQAGWGPVGKSVVGGVVTGVGSHILGPIVQDGAVHVYQHGIIESAKIATQTIMHCFGC